MASDAVFADRADAGRQLAATLIAQIGGLDPHSPHPQDPGTDVIVLGLARGGVPVAREVADRLDAKLDTLVVRKVGAPGNPEYAMGAVAGGGLVVVNDDVPRRLGVSQKRFDEAVARETRLLDERERRYRGDRPAPALRGATVILVDDGLATGMTMRVAVEAARRGGAARVIVAVPTAPADTLAVMRTLADAAVAVAVPPGFVAVGLSYKDFHQVSDDEVGLALST